MRLMKFVNIVYTAYRRRSNEPSYRYDRRLLILSSMDEIFDIIYDSINIRQVTYAGLRVTRCRSHILLLL